MMCGRSEATMHAIAHSKRSRYTMVLCACVRSAGAIVVLGLGFFIAACCVYRDRSLRARIGEDMAPDTVREGGQVTRIKHEAGI